MTGEEFNAKQEELLGTLPEPLKAFIRAQAWDIGHAYGYQEVLIHVENMADRMRTAVKEMGL